MGASSPPAQQTVTQKTEIDPIKKSFLFGTKLPAEYKSQILARNQSLGLLGPGSSAPQPEPEPDEFQPTRDQTKVEYFSPENQHYLHMNQPGDGGGGGFAQGGIVGLPTAGGMTPPTMGGAMPNLSNREQAYLMGAQALQGAMQPQPQQRPMTGMQQRPMRGYAVGGYVEGPGTGRSDSIPATIYQDGQPVQDAALSDGEFVMTERAVRGAGAGDREAGAARMYEMMRRFENGGRVS